MGTSIQNEDVKSKEELQARGATPDRLIHDKKIWVTANDILKPLDQAITDGDIGAEVGVGSAYRFRSIAYGDGSTEEYGVTEPPFLDDNGNTVIRTDYIIQDDAFIKVIVDKKEWIQYISDAVTPDFWWYKEGSNKIIIKGDHTGGPVRLEVQIMDGVDLPPILSSLYAGMDLLGDAYGYVDFSNGSAGVTDIIVESGKTKITIDTQFTNDDYVFVYVNNEYFVPFKLGITSDKYYTLEGNNTVVLDGDYSGQSLPFYIAVFRGKFFQDELGNVCFKIGASLREFAIESDNNGIWALSVTNAGEIVSESGSLTAPDPIRLIRDDGTLVALLVTNDGEYVVDDNPIAGIAFEHLHLLSQDGFVWHVGVDNDNILYLDSSELASNKFCLEDSYGNIVHEVQNTPDGALFKLRHFKKGSLPENPDQLTQNTLIAIEQDEISGPRMMQYDTFQQKWRPVAGDSKSAPVGEVKHTILNPVKVKQLYGPDWEPMDGTVQIPIVDVPELAELLPEWHDGNTLTIPNAHDYDIDVRTWHIQNGNGANHNTASQSLYPPENMTIADHWAGISSISRIYYAGTVNADDTTVNDYHVDGPGNRTYTNIYNSEQRATAYSQMLSLYRKLKKEQRYIKVR